MNFALQSRIFFINYSNIQKFTILNQNLSTNVLRSKLSTNFIRNTIQIRKNNFLISCNQLRLKSSDPCTYFRFRRGDLSKSSKNGQILINNRSIQIQNQLKQNLNQSKDINRDVPIEQVVKKSIFKRFKEAYKQHGKILLWCHVITCCGWIVGFFLLSEG